jgi:hypothetical protein
MRAQYAFISRHEPTLSQWQMAARKGIDLVWVGDLDGFTVTKQEVIDAYDKKCEEYRDTSPNGQDYAYGWPEVTGVVVVHAAAALRLAPHFWVGVFENGNRAPEGEKPSFEPVALHFYGDISAEFKNNQWAAEFEAEHGEFKTYTV